MYKLRCISKLVSLHSSKHVSLHSSTTACTSCAPNTSEIDPAQSRYMRALLRQSVHARPRDRAAGTLPLM